MRALLLLLFFCGPAFAQSYQYELKGSYKLESSKNTPVNFNLQWSEENGDIRGTYKDDHFSQVAKVEGTNSPLGRTFLVTFSQTKLGVRSITILSSGAGIPKTATTMPVSFITRDPNGSPLTTTKAETSFQSLSESRIAQLEEESNCREGFGELTGYCGIYAGILAEQSDRRNRCNLLFADRVRFELTTEGMVYLHLGEVNELINTPGHSIGRIPPNPETSTVDLLSRVCGPLSGVNSSQENCKRLHLTGDFTLENGIQHFAGTYTITEEGTNNQCQYSLSMDKQQ